MPVGSGLGSSACSVVAALVALNEYTGRPLEEMALLRLMGEMEGRISGSVHYDNVAPASSADCSSILKPATASARLCRGLNTGTG